MRTSLVRRSLVVVVAALASQVAAVRTARAELPPLIPREVLFGNPDRSSPEISPDGTRLAYLRADARNVMQVWVRTIGKEDDRAVTRERRRGIRSFSWAHDGRRLLYLQDGDGDENSHVFAVNLESGETRDLTPFVGVRAEIAAREPLRPGEILVEMNRRSRDVFDLYLVDLESGSLAVMQENPGRATAWLVDRRMDARGFVASKPDGGSELLVPRPLQGDRKTLLSWGAEDRFAPIGFSKDGNTLYALSNVGADTTGLVAMDFETGGIRVLASEEGVDAGRPLVHPDTGEPQAVPFARDRVRWKVLDPAIEPDLAALAKVADGELAVTSRDQKDEVWTVSFSSDTKPTHWYLWRRAEQRAEHLFSARKELDALALAPMKFVEIKARDGLMLPSYLTLPVGVEPKNLPLVLQVHGGPWARDRWGFHPLVQHLANRGYAVLQVNYRGSSGFGKRHTLLAKREFAGKMHDDLVDGVRWAIAEGIADPKRVGISGGSYGGYATLVGLAFTPEVFACGVDVVGPSNLVSLVESFPPYWGPNLVNTWYPYVGDPRDPKDRADMEARSPLFRVDKIRAPLLVGQGANDPRVTRKESDQMVEALRKRGLDVEYIVFDDEGHGFARPENRLRFYAASEAFLAKHLGGRREP
jgi:dipeptidyl aminopeptidase/acylaminoacyl peptidase